MGDALTRIMNLPCTGFDNDGEETVNREAAAAIVRELEARLADKADILGITVRMDGFRGCLAFAVQNAQHDGEESNLCPT